jgi:hypothetical protein
VHEQQWFDAFVDHVHAMNSAGCFLDLYVIRSCVLTDAGVASAAAAGADLHDPQPPH